MKRVAVLASGSGSNLQAIVDYQSALAGAGSAPVVLVGSDHADAGALARARDAGITALALDQVARTSGLATLLSTHRVEMVVLAGYRRLVPAEVVARFRGRIVNVHPALLPQFGGHGMYGHRVHEAVVARGVRLTGPTVHFVDARYDEGPIIAQWPVPVWPADTPGDVARRVLEVEHILYPRVVDAVAAGRIRLTDNNQVVFDPGPGLNHFGPGDVSSIVAHLNGLLGGFPR
jgi:formyltetrahydrofolate-dependent phosphoribosylglycinamide formyltransferase